MVIRIQDLENSISHSSLCNSAVRSRKLIYVMIAAATVNVVRIELDISVLDASSAKMTIFTILSRGVKMENLGGLTPIVTVKWQVIPIVSTPLVNIAWMVITCGMEHVFQKKVAKKRTDFTLEYCQKLTNMLVKMLASLVRHHVSHTTLNFL